MIDLVRIATAARRAGRAVDADGLVWWVTQQAVLNYDLIPENYDKTTGNYYGAVPMVGFGAGAYVTALWDRAAAEPIDGDGGGDAGTSAKPAAGCGCETSGGGAGGSVLVFAVGTLLVRRRRTCAAR